MTRRLPTRSPKKFPLLLCIFLPVLLAIGVYYGIGSYYLPKERTTILFLTDPVEVASFEPSRQQWSRVQFPASTHIAGIQGLGEYAVDSLWNIAATEGSPSAIVLGSVTDELGVPIDYYIGEKEQLWKKNEHKSIVSSYFTIGGILKRLSNAFDTNIPIPLYIALTRSLRSTQQYTIETALLEKGNGLGEKKLPDSSTILEFNREQFDAMTADIFEDSQIRDERLRIAVFNTTGRPFLGSRVARIINRLGSNVIQVGNEDTSLENCELSGTSEHLQTKTAKTIQQLFRCELDEITEQGRADLTIRIGTVYESRFTPPSLLLP